MVHARPCPDAVTRLPRIQRALVIALCAWALFALACATPTAAPAAREAGPVFYSAPRALESSDFAVAPPLPAGEAPDAVPILGEAPAEPSSLFIAREILADRAAQLGELEREG